MDTQSNAASPQSTEMQMADFKILSLDKITINQGIQVRVCLSKDTVDDYAERMREGDDFPPIDVFHDGTNYWLANGFHRHAATRQIGRSEIKVRLHRGAKREALLFALKADTNYGLRRTNRDKRRAFELMWEDSEWRKWSHGIKAKTVGVSERTISNWEKEVSPKITETEQKKKFIRNGKEYEMTIPAKKAATVGKEPTATALASQSKAPGSELPPANPNKGEPIKKEGGKLLKPSKVAREISVLEKSVTEISDQLDRLLSDEKELDLGRGLIDAVADLHRITGSFLKKFRKEA